MKRRILIGIILILTTFILGCTNESEYERTVYNLPDNPEIFFCETDADCGHLTGCNEDGGSPCVNIEYTEIYGAKKRNCDPEDVGFCYNCECIENKCTNVIDPDYYGC